MRNLLSPSKYDEQKLKVPKDLEDQFLALSDNFDILNDLTLESNQLLDTKLIDLYDKTLDLLDKLGVSWDPKALKKRDLATLLD